MSYNFESLNDERFQQLCQALIVRRFPDAQCLPVGQPDGGRDAFLIKHKDGKKTPFIVYQVKYSKEPLARTERDAIRQLIATEREKVQHLIKRGANAYYFITNVQGTSHLDVGFIDQVNKELSESFGIESFCWWRDDLARRLDDAVNVKWSYPEILRGTDILQGLVQVNMSQDVVRRTTILRSYLAKQYESESKLKFKQIDLAQDITGLFVDVPVRLVAPKDEAERVRWRERLLAQGLPNLIAPNELLPSYASDIREAWLARAPGVVQLLTQGEVVRYLPKIVIEGAPGQGKSTVTQYLCQTYRMMLLQRDADLSKVEKIHQPTEVRVPFRVDLRDYASWLAGRDPFSDDPDAKLLPDTSKLLESLIVAQIKRYTGQDFSIGDLTALTQSSQVLLVLDGFDEVADVPSRNKMVEEISEATARIAANSLSIQTIVTSRPAVFTNSPGFPKQDWQHMELLSLPKPTIELYTQRWLDVRGAEPREKRAITEVLRAKLDQPHIRDLARNPMQLAILLNLTYVQGASLPDERTTLYDRYIDIFFNREAEKSKVVRDHRALLVRIHRYLAWTLQMEAEKNTSGGNIAESRLRSTIRDYLEDAGHASEFIDELFKGVKERVAALVSRVQGTWEFEVQPLREYFAARYLYDTAPHTPATQKINGSRPERFDAIARNSYWLNVTRFYAGCYSSGELSSLLDGLEELDTSQTLQHTAYSRHLGLTLLSDYVFDQYPKIAAKLVSYITTPPGFRLILSRTSYGFSESSLRLPSNSGSERLVKACKELITDNAQLDVVFSAARVMAWNCPTDLLHQFWLEKRENIKDVNQWLYLGAYLSIYEGLPTAECIALARQHGATALSLLMAHERYDAFEQGPELWKRLAGGVLDGAVTFYPYFRSNPGTVEIKPLLTYLSLMLTPTLYSVIVDDTASRPLRDALRRRFSSIRHEKELDQTTSAKSSGEDVLGRAVTEALRRLLDCPLTDWKNSLEPWSELAETIRSDWGERWSVYKLAVASTLLAKVQSCPITDLHDLSVPICLRAGYARSAGGDLEWWRCQIDAASILDPHVAKFVLVLARLWMSMENLILLHEEISGLLNSLPLQDWRDVSEALESLPPLRNKPLSSRALFVKLNMPVAVTPRFATLLMARMASGVQYWLYRRYLSNYSENDPVVLEAAIDVLGKRAALRPREWDTALPVIAFAYMQGVIYRSLHVPREGKGATFLVAQAEVICKEPAKYPLNLVSFAEATLVAKATEAAIPVGNISLRDQWFDQEELGAR